MALDSFTAMGKLKVFWRHASILFQRDAGWNFRFQLCATAGKQKWSHHSPGTGTVLQAFEKIRQESCPDWKTANEKTCTTTRGWDRSDDNWHFQVSSLFKLILVERYSRQNEDDIGSIKITTSLSENSAMSYDIHVPGEIMFRLGLPSTVGYSL